MAELKVKDINESLQKKGFVKKANDHNFFYYMNDGKKTNIRTKTSFGSKGTIGDNLISAMAKQVKLSKAEFLPLIQCTLSKEDYKKILIDRKII